MRAMFLGIYPLALLLSFALPTHGDDSVIEPEIYQLGVAKVDITPRHPIRLNGFGGRRAESEGVREPIWAKAIAVQSATGEPHVLLTCDILGVPDRYVDEIVRRVSAKRPLKRENLVVSSSHTHCGPMLEGENVTLFGVPIPDEHLSSIARFTKEFLDKTEKVVLEALADMRPCTLKWGIGKVPFAINRRTQGGPVDHDLPMLVAFGEDKSIRAIYVSYACHCVTLSENMISGDWAGYAQSAIESKHPGAIALTSIGCGADSNPSTGVTGAKYEAAREQGMMIASEVERLLGNFLAPVYGKLESRFEKKTLPLQALPSRAEWEERAKREDAIGHYARVQLAKLDHGQALRTEIAYPIQTWRFGKSLAMVHLASEVVVDYSLRLKKELDSSRLWVNAYCNDTPGYIPSERILKEGGYEGGGAMVYYDIPAHYAAGLEDKIIQVVRSQLSDFKVAFQVDRVEGTFPLSAQQSLGQWSARPEFRVQLVAAEPLLQDPVAITFGPDGRMWVAEMYDYPRGVDGQFKPGGRVRWLEDTDGDGVYDRSGIYLDGVPFPTGITIWREGVLICAAPAILYAPDHNGDGKADSCETLFTGFGDGNYQGRVNSLEYGLDGWVYGSCGIFGGEILSFNGTKLALGDRDFRMKPDTGEMEPAIGRTQQGRVRNDWGDWFGCNSGNLLIHYPIADHYLKRNSLVKPPPTEVGIAPSNQLFPNSSLILWKLSGPPGRATAACGLGIYRDKWLGSEGSNDNAFTCEPVNQVVHRLRLTEIGSQFQASREPQESESEFLASKDTWCRPVQATTGPDGALYIADMYRFLIEHPRWIPEQDLARIDDRAGSHLGRIYRVFPADRSPRCPKPLSALSSSELVAELDTSNGPRRDLAARLLVWKGAIDQIESLEVSARSAKHAEGRLQSLAILKEFGRLSEDVVLRALQDMHPGVRRWAAEFSATLLGSSTKLFPQLTQMVSDQDAKTRMSVAYSMGFAKSDRIGETLATLAFESIDDPYVQAAVYGSLADERAVRSYFLAALAAPKELTAKKSILQNPLEIAVAQNQWDLVDRWIDTFLGSDSIPSEDRLITLKGLFDNFRRHKDWRSQLAPKSLKTIQDQVELARTIAERSNETSISVRSSAIRALGASSDQEVKDFAILVAGLATTEPLESQAASIDALAALSERPQTANGLASSTIAEVILDRWATFGPLVRAEALSVIQRNPLWTNMLLGRIETKSIGVADVSIATIEQLARHPDAAIAERARHAFGASNPLREQVVSQYHVVANLEGQQELGKAKFRKTCSACHKVEEQGHVVGPELTAVANKPIDYLTLAVLDPQRAIDPRYVGYTVTTNDGNIHTGILASETSSSVVLLAAEGKTVTLTRAEIEEMRSTGRSLMPEGLERELSPQDLADVFAYLRSLAPRPTNEPAKGSIGVKRVISPNQEGDIVLLAEDAQIIGGSITLESGFRNVGMWHGANDHVIWNVGISAPSEYDVYLHWACADESSGNRYRLSGAQSEIGGKVMSTGGWNRYTREKIGTVKFNTGVTELKLAPETPMLRPALMDLFAIECVPLGKAPSLKSPSFVAIQLGDAPSALSDIMLDEKKPEAAREQAVKDALKIPGETIAYLAKEIGDQADEYRKIPWIWRVAVETGRKNDDAKIREILEVALPKVGESMRDWQVVVVGGGAVMGVSDAGVWPRQRMAELLKGTPELNKRFDHALSLAEKIADDEKVPTGSRYDALRLRACAGWKEAGAQLKKYLAKGAHPELQMGSVSACVDIPEPEAIKAITDALSYLEGQNQKLAIKGLMKSKDRRLALIHALETKPSLLEALDDGDQRALIEDKDRDVSDKAKKVIRKP